MGDASQTMAPSAPPKKSAFAEAPKLPAGLKGLALRQGQGARAGRATPAAAAPASTISGLSQERLFIHLSRRAHHPPGGPLSARAPARAPVRPPPSPHQRAVERAPGKPLPPRAAARQVAGGEREFGAKEAVQLAALDAGSTIRCGPSHAPPVLPPFPPPLPPIVRFRAMATACDYCNEARKRNRTVPT